MMCPKCKEYELEVYDYEDCYDGGELAQKQNLWCPGCQYHCQYKVWFKETAREIVWEEE